MSPKHPHNDSPECASTCQIMESHKDGTHKFISMQLVELKENVSHIPKMKVQLNFIIGGVTLVLAAVLAVLADRWIPKRDTFGGGSIAQHSAVIEAPAMSNLQASSLSQLR